VARRNAEFKNAESEYNRYANLFKQGAISESDLDRRKLSLQTAFAALEQAIKERDQAVKELDQSQQVKTSLTQSRPVDVQQAEAQVQTALANLERAKAELDTSAVRSPITGRVIKVHAKEGEQVRGSFSGSNTTNQTCEGIAELGRTDQMYAVAEVYETDVTRIRRGQRAIVTSSAFPDQLPGTVEQVGLKIGKKDVLDTDPAADTDARVVEVRVRLDDSRPVANLTNLQVNVAISP
jgi:HlyD family secretion protein